MKKLLHISIVGEPPKLDPLRFARLSDGTADDAVWIGNRLRELGIRDALAFEAVYPFRGEPLPDPAGFDIVILGGSYPSINDGLDWQRATLAWLERYRASGKPLLGICGGHQMMSHLAGAPVSPLDLGGDPHAGSLAVTLNEAGREHFLFRGLGGAPKFHFGNFEHVESPPPGARVLGSTACFDIAALDHGGGWVSVQFHPEGLMDAMMADYAITHPHLIGRFEPLPDAPRLLLNFLEGAGALG